MVDLPIPLGQGRPRTEPGSGSAAGRLQWLPIPVITARTMGQFRVVLGLLLFFVILANPPVPQPFEMHRNYSRLADWSFVHRIAASDLGCRIVGLSTLALSALFTIGWWTRRVYALLIGGLLLSRFIDLQRTGTHDWDLPMLTLLTFVVVPWGDGFSVDARRARADETRAGRLYGLAIWIPGLTIGLALLAAAYAKLTTSGVAWITTGAVKYHFVEDAAAAPVDWGLWVASQPRIAVAMALAAVAIESLFIAVIFVRSAWIRMLVGAAGLSLFGGFFLFQGVVWRPWLILFAAFLPWPLLDRPSDRRVDAARLRPAHAAVLFAVVLQQATASLTGTELEPVVSPYGMYSGTFESPEAFERIRHRKLQRLVFEAAGADITEQVLAIPNASEDLLLAAERARDSEVPAAQQRTALHGFRREYQARFGAAPEAITVIAERVSFDWNTGTFRPPARVRVGDVQLPPL